jgi:elongation factor P
MIDVNELRKGVTFEMDGALYKVLDYSHNKTGRGNASIRIKARNLMTGANIERTFSSGQSVQDVRLDFHNVSYLYTDGELYHFMDNETFDQPALEKDMIGETALYLMAGMEAKLTFYNDKPLDIELPTSVDMEVVEAEMAIRGDTATGVTKKVTTEIRVDTRTGGYLTRV